TFPWGKTAVFLWAWQKVGKQAEQRQDYEPAEQPGSFPIGHIGLDNRLEDEGQGHVQRQEQSAATEQGGRKPQLGDPAAQALPARQGQKSAAHAKRSGQPLADENRLGDEDKGDEQE